MKRKSSRVKIGKHTGKGEDPPHTKLAGRFKDKSRQSHFYPQEAVKGHTEQLGVKYGFKNSNGEERANPGLLKMSLKLRDQPQDTITYTYMLPYETWWWGLPCWSSD